jgi:protein-disulfide isomerase
LGRLCTATALAAVALLGTGGCPVKDATPEDVGPAAGLEVRADDHVLAVGSPTVTVIEYGDFECPICGFFEQQTFPAIKANYIDTGKVRWVYRHFPLREKHPHAEAAAEASECAAAQDRFWDYHDLLLRNQLALGDDDLRGYAAQLGLDTAAFDTCLTSGAEAARVEEDVQSANTLAVSHTPTFFIGQQQVIGLLTVEEFSQLLDAALAANAGS